MLGGLLGAGAGVVVMIVIGHKASPLREWAVELTIPVVGGAVVAGALKGRRFGRSAEEMMPPSTAEQPAISASRDHGDDAAPDAGNEEERLRAPGRIEWAPAVGAGLRAASGWALLAGLVTWYGWWVGVLGGAATLVAAFRGMQREVERQLRAPSQRAPS